MTSRRCIALVEDRHDDLYGAQINGLLLASTWQQHGHHVHVVTTGNGRFADAARRQGLDTIVVETPPALLRLGRVNPLRSPRAWLDTAWSLVRLGFTMKRAIEALDADVVVANSLRSSVMLWATGLRRRPPIILWVQSDVRFPVRGTVAALLARRIGLISDQSAATFPRAVRRLFRGRIRALPSGRVFDPIVDRAPSDGENITIVTICAITPRKGIDRLIDAIARANIRGARLIVVGGTTGASSEALHATLIRLAHDRGVDAEFVGWQEDVTPFLMAADIFALASQNEGLPGVLLEAMAAGVACVTTRAGGAGDLVERCGAGLVVDVGDQEALADAIRTLADDEASRAEFGLAGAQNVRRHFSLDASYRAIADMIDEITPNRAVR